MDRISGMMEETTAEVEGSAPAETGKGSKAMGQDRVQSLLDMDYDEPEKKDTPVEESKKEHPVPTGDGAKSTKKEEDSEDSEEKEDKKESKDKKEEKKEAEKKEAEKKKYKYKVDGQEVEEELSDDEVASAISGRKAIQKRFTELDQEKKQVLKEKEEVQSTVKYIQEEMGGLKTGFESAIQEFAKKGFNESNPAESVYNLLDKMGLDTAQFEKALFFHHIPEVAKFLDMDDTGREAYLLAHENKWLKKHKDAIESEKREAQEYKAKLDQENSMMRQAGVSTEEFSELKNELESRFGLKDLKLEQVLEWKQAKPAYSRAEAIVEKVPGTNAHKIAKLLLEFPETTDEWILENLGYKQHKEAELSEKLKSKAPPKPTRKTQEDTDEDIELFKQFRRR